VINSTTFKAEYGYDSREDDLERVNCTEPKGNGGHDSCGQHTCCGFPRFIGHGIGCDRDGKPRWESVLYRREPYCLRCSREMEAEYDLIFDGS
jgi:hypothetical protein